MLITFYFIFLIQKWSLGPEFLGKMIHQRSSTITKSHLAAFDSVPGVIYHGVSRTHLFSTLANATNLPTPPLASIPSFSLSLSSLWHYQNWRLYFFCDTLSDKRGLNICCVLRSVIRKMKGYRESSWQFIAAGMAVGGGGVGSAVCHLPMELSSPRRIALSIKWHCGLAFV